MPRIVEYEQVLAALTARGMKSLYYNSGSFGFAMDEHICGWIGLPDPTIREAARPHCVNVPAPHMHNLVFLLQSAWNHLFPGPLWIMPGSNWAYEFDLGGMDWAPAALKRIGIDDNDLAKRVDAPAIEFDPSESKLAGTFVEEIFARGGDDTPNSDFSAAFPAYPVTCVIHHHVQLWWRTNDTSMQSGLLALPGRAPVDPRATT